MDLGTMILVLIGGSTAMLALGLLAKGIDRKVTARLQWRVGPPLYQPMIDCLKLLGKETVMPAVARGTGFLMMPLFGLASGCVAATLLWAMNLRLGAAASGSPHAVVGASREMKLLISYELPLTIALVTAVVHTGGSFQIGRIVEAQQQSGAVAASVSGFLAFLVAIVCMEAKLGLVPFDQAEAETELMAGVYTEYSGPPLAVIFGWGALASAGKFLVLLMVITLIRNTNPRLRIDQCVRFFWYMVTPAALAALALAVAGRAWEVSWL